MDDLEAHRAANRRRRAGLVLVLLFGVAGAACASGGVVASPITPGALNPSLGIDLAMMTRTPEGLYFEDLAVGSGDLAVARSRVTVAYRGLLANGTVVDSSMGMSVRLGTGQVVKGWDIGIVGMRVGGARLLVIPPELGYGAREAGAVPPNSILIFRVQLLAVRK